MNFQGLCHIEKSNYAYAYSNRELHLRLRTAKDDCTGVFVVIARKHVWSEKKAYSMEKVATDRYFDYYQYNFTTDDPRLGYYFLISDGKQTLVYSESGVSKTFDDQYAYLHYFQYPFINPVDVHHVPDWVHEAVFYQIFVERFCNGDQSNDPEKLSTWDELPTPSSFYGGDLQGIISKLDYLQKLGITGLYLTPIFESRSNHKYDTTDYRKVDPAFGDTETLCRLVSEAHKRGIRVVLDGVFNHCGENFAPFQDVMKNGSKSKYAGWFHFLQYPDGKKEARYRTFSDCGYMPKLNTSNPGMKKYLLDTVTGWMRATGIDGWRLDVSDEVDHEFWRSFRKAVKAVNPEAVIIGENWHDARPWLEGDQFDGVMNYPVTKACIRYFATQELNAKLFSADLSCCLMWNSEQANFSMLNLLDSHDTMRFLTWCGGDKRRVKLAVLFLFSYVGIPCTYYGSEIGMKGKGDPDSRRTFNWDQSTWDTDLWNFYHAAMMLRRESIALQRGDVRMWAKDDVFYLKRFNSAQTILTVLNNTSSEKEFSLPDGVSPEVLLKSGEILNGNLAPFSGAILKLK